MKKISLTRGKFALVDDEDYEYLSQWNWFCLNKGYAVRSVADGKGKQKLLLMHRLINNTPQGLYTDHISQNRLDNRRENLRSVTRSQNGMNRTRYKNSASKYKGVSGPTSSGKWRATIKQDNKYAHLGTFLNEKDAAKAYNVKAKELFGNFCHLNEI
jgi:hypothetical protein